MLRKIAKWFFDSRIKSSSTQKMAFASSIGIFIGMLPLFGVRIPILLALSLLFPLNFPALLFGVFVPFILPFLHELSFFLGQKIAGFEIPYSNLRYLSFSHLLQWSPGTQYHLIGSFVVGIFLSLFFYPFFRWIYRFPILKNMKEHKTFIFLDPKRKRWTLVKKVIAVILAVGLIVGVVFGISISINPYLPALGLKKIRQFPGISPIDQQLGEKTLTKELRKEYQKKNKPLPVATKSGNIQNVMAFYVSWDENSLNSLQQNIGSIQTLIPDWFHLNQDCTLGSQIHEQVDLFAQSRQVKETPLINNYVNDKWDGEIVHRLLSNQPAQNQLILNLANQIKGHHYSGINIDFEGLLPQDQKLYTLFIEKISNEFHKQSLTVTLDLPPKDGTDTPFDYKALAAAADQIVLMAYDEHYEGGDPGPIASGKFIQDSIASVDVPRNKLTVSLGNYGYDWIDNSTQAATEVTYADILSMAADGKLKIYWNKESGNPYTRYREGNEDHTLWFLDGATFYNQLKISTNNGVTGLAIWRLGSEDPSIWKEIKDNQSLASPSSMLNTLESPDPVQYIGKGEVLKIVSIAKQGRREVTFNGNGFVDGENYVSFPTPYEVERFGKPKSKEIALTFDDGPDPNYTPKILDTLAQYHVLATFFVVGQNASVNPDLIERMYREGHEIGNHTFTHPNVAEVSSLQTKVELNTTERLIQELTGHSSVLFRPPYVADAEPSSPGELLPILRAQETGYTMIGEMIDPLDWTRPAPDEIVKRINGQLNYGNVILLHDAGGDRSNTVKALPKIIESLRSQGYTFVTVGDLIGKNRDAVMPPVNPGDNPYMLYDTIVFSVFSILLNFITYLFYAAIVLGVFRLLFLGYYALKQKRKRAKAIPTSDSNFSPHVSVVIAAYNEEKVIVKTIESILKSDYPNFEVIIVDDGSTDHTSKVVQDNFALHPQVRLITKTNGGKSSAINRGIRKARGEIIVALDADTLIRKDAISRMLRHFIDPMVAAVSGNIKVGNVNNLLTNWQHIEYVTGFNLERRAFSMFNCITVVPGAIGAWRKEAVIKCGLYKEDTLAEDTDLTLQLLKEGYKIEFEEFAFAYTEAPSDLNSLFKQRFRWTYGTLQCLWKYRKELFNPKRKSLGFIALPNMWLFQFIFQALSPIADVYFIFGLFGAHPWKVIVFYFLFFMLDFIASFFAFKLEGEKYKPLFWVFLQRILYRQIMALVVLKSIVAAVKGMAVGWNKLKRQGDVEVPTTVEKG